MVKELVRDTVLGHALRIFTKSKVFAYEEERDPELWKRYISHEKTGNMAHHGTVGEEEKEGKEEEKDGEDSEEQSSSPDARHRSRHSSSADTRVNSQDQNVNRNEVTGHPVDPEKGKDLAIVDWYSDTDPEVCRLSFNLPLWHSLIPFRTQ